MRRRASRECAAIAKRWLVDERLTRIDRAGARYSASIEEHASSRLLKATFRLAHNLPQAWRFVWNSGSRDNRRALKRRARFTWSFDPIRILAARIAHAGVETEPRAGTSTVPRALSSAE
jgi:hypothetical protein